MCRVYRLVFFSKPPTARDPSSLTFQKQDLVFAETLDGLDLTPSVFGDATEKPLVDLILKKDPRLKTLFKLQELTSL